jgi:hypothetical protein
MGAAVALTALTVTDAHSRRWEGGLLVTVFLSVAVWFWFA